MNRKLLRVQGDRFCQVEIALTDGRLSITGSEGRVVTRSAARKEARAYWVGYFEESPEAITEMNERCGTRFRSAVSAAKYVLDNDGEFHGLDLLSVGPDAYVVESCGQIVDTIREFFPELTPALPWHLNDMRAGCEHQDGRACVVGQKCEVCGYLYGTEWLRRELPVEIVSLVSTVRS
jgi:hypothetical protein